MNVVCYVCLKVSNFSLRKRVIHQTHNLIFTLSFAVLTAVHHHILEEGSSKVGKLGPGEEKRRHNERSIIDYGEE